MSAPHVFLRSIRLRRNISELKAARRAEMPLETFVEYERHPESVPADELYKMFQAIEMTEDEYLDFERVLIRAIDSKRIELMVKTKSKGPALDSTPGDVLKFRKLTGLKRSKTASPKARATISVTGKPKPKK